LAAPRSEKNAGGKNPLQLLLDSLGFQRRFDILIHIHIPQIVHSTGD